ncbi:MAG: hypothetical protein IT346_01735 [Epsilonproteobacteria bacterium]|nr:hypothetical protein [Campylobacterota bacterium]
MNMYYVRYSLQSIALTFLFFIQTNYCAVVISSLKIPLGPTFFNMATGALSCGATESGLGEQSLMRSPSAGAQLLPAAPREVTLNTIANSVNPLFDQEITHLSGMITPDSFGRPGVERILAVTAQKPSALVMIDMAANQTGTFLRSIDALCDATGKPSAGIVALEGTQVLQNGVFAAVKPEKGLFGEQGSGIALVSFGSVEMERHKKKSTEWHFNQIPLGHTPKLISAQPIDVTTKAAAIGNHLAHVGQTVALHWNGTLQRLFVGLDVTAGNEQSDGACALLVGKMVTHTCSESETAPSYTHQSLDLEPCITHTAVVNTSSTIIATRGAGSRVTIHKITSFKTSTDLWYVVVVGGCADGQMTQQTVTALPLNVDGQQIGTIAAIEQEPETFFGPKENPTFRGRAMRKKTETAEQASLNNNRCVQVGAGPLLAGPITTIFAEHDAIFAVVGGEQPDAGVYHSQALFDGKGIIKGWTAWRQVYQSDDAYLQAAFYDNLGGSFTLLSRSQNPDERAILKKTVWGSGDPKRHAGLVSFLRDTYTKDTTGIRAHTDIHVGMPGFAHQSCMVVGGYQAMTIAIMAERDEMGVVRPILSDALKKDAACLVHYSGGTVASLGTIEAITSAATDTQAWLFAGGSGGLAVYADADGAGWDPCLPIERADLLKKIFIPFGSYTFVRRLVHDGDYLYVLTDKSLDRIDLTRSCFKPNNLHIEKTTLAERAQFSLLHQFGCFTDVIVSDKIAFLATSRGLYRTGDHRDIRFAHSSAEVAWTAVELGGDEYAIVHLDAASTTGLAIDVARYGGGNLYVIQGYPGRNDGTIKRFSVGDVAATSINEQIITIVPDTRIQHAPTMFRRIGSYARRCTTDGALWVYVRKEANNVSSLCTITQLYPMRDTHLLLHNTPESSFALVQRCAASQGAWWALGQSVVVNE